MSYQNHYGYPCVTDPNDFTPDVECCSPAELEAHKLACMTFGKSNYQPNKGCVTERDESGQLVRHILRTSWGIGINSIRCCDECREPVDDFVTCRDCGGYLDFCPVCWPEHAKTCEPEGSAR